MGKSSINGSLWLGKSTNQWRICHLAMFDYQTMSHSHNPRPKPTKIFKCLGGSTKPKKSCGGLREDMMLSGNVMM